MGRTEPSQGLQPPAKRKEVRAKQAKGTVNKIIPSLVASTSRAKKGVDAAELIVDPPRLARPSAPEKTAGSAFQEGEKTDLKGASDDADDNPSFTVRILVTDSLTAASALYTTRRPSKKNVALLNMASPLRPGGGVLNGATSQEEFLCTRTTLLPSLRDEFYRLPELGGIFSPEVLVFRDSEGEDLAKGERWYVNVVSAGMLRFPDLDDVGGYASGADAKLVEAKMRAVLRILGAKGTEQVVLGAWGCGAFGNPVEAIAKAWRKVLLGQANEPSKGRHGAKPERWETLKEVVFAIKEHKMAEYFASAFGGDLSVEFLEKKDSTGSAVEDDDVEKANITELQAKVADMEEQMSRVLNPDLKERLEVILTRLRADLEYKLEPKD